MSGRETLAQARAAEDAVGAAAMKKAIWRLGPFLGLLYLVAYIDRNNAGFAKLEMTAALQITEAAFGFAAGIFFIAEAGFFPGVLLYLTLWFPRQYRTQVLAVFVLSNPIANAVAAPLSGWMLELHGLWGLDGWQLVFLLQGVPAVLLAFVVFFWLPDRPQDARWLTPAEQRWITDTLAAETQATEQRHGRLRLGEVFRNGRLWTLIVLFFGVVKSMGDFSSATTGWLVALPNLCAALVMLPWERAARKQGNIPLQIGITLSVTALSLIAAVAAQGTPVLALAALCVGMSALFSTPPLFWSLPPMVLTGTAAAAGLAFINSVGNLAGFAGPYAIGWISETTGSAVWGLLLISGLTLLGATIAFVLSRRNDFTTAPALADEVSPPRR